MKRWHWAVLLIFCFSVGISLVLPLFDNKSVFERIQETFFGAKEEPALPLGATFGDTGEYGSSQNWENYVILGNFTCPSDGIADNITARVRMTDGGASHSVKACIYYMSNYTLVGNTSEYIYTKNDFLWEWKVFEFTIKPNLVSGEQYGIGTWVNSTDGSFYVDFETSTGNGIYIDYENYNTENGIFDNPLTGVSLWNSDADRILSVYCSYTEPSVRTWQNIFTGYATGGNATVSWQQIFTGYATGGNATVSWQNIFLGYATGGNNSIWKQIFSGYATGGNQSIAQNIFTGYATGGNATVPWQNIFTGYATGGNATVSWQNIFLGYATGGNITSPQNIFSGYATGGNATVSWQQIFTGYATGGNATVTWNNIFTGYATGGNVTVSWQNIFNGYAIGGNTTIGRYWQNIFNGYATGGNTTPPPNITISNEYPEHESFIYHVQPALNFTVNHTYGLTMNFSIYIGNSSANATTLLHFELNITNGTFYSQYIQAVEYYQDHYWKIICDDGTDSITEIYNFSISNLDNTQLSMIKRSYGKRSYLFLALFIGVLVVFIVLTKKKNS